MLPVEASGRAQERLEGDARKRDDGSPFRSVGRAIALESEGTGFSSHRAFSFFFFSERAEKESANCDP